MAAVGWQRIHAARLPYAGDRASSKGRQEKRLGPFGDFSSVDAYVDRRVFAFVDREQGDWYVARARHALENYGSGARLEESPGGWQFAAVLM